MTGESVCSQGTPNPGHQGGMFPFPKNQAEGRSAWPRQPPLRSQAHLGLPSTVFWENSPETLQHRRTGPRQIYKHKVLSSACWLQRNDRNKSLTHKPQNALVGKGSRYLKCPCCERQGSETKRMLTRCLSDVIRISRSAVTRGDVRWWRGSGVGKDNWLERDAAESMWSVVCTAVHV